MKKILTILLAILTLACVQNKSFAASIQKEILNSKINKNTVSISIKDIKTGKVVYQQNEKQPMLPASTLKIITTSAAFDTLGKDYEFKTQLYKNKNNELYFKLGADPYFTSKDLRGMISKAKAKNIIAPKTIFVDDYILDGTEWGEGWQWDDELNYLMPKFSSYNIDGNLLHVIIAPTTPNSPAKIYTTKFYPATFMNLVSTGEKNSISINRNNNISPDLITLEGTVSKQYTALIPVNHPKRYFFLRLDDAIKSEKFGYYGGYKQTKLPTQNIYLVDEIKHSILSAISDIYKNSNNYVAETVFKLAGGKFVNSTGSQANSVKMLNAYFEKIGLNPENIKIVDSSGVSKNNIMTTDFMTEFLIKRYQCSDFEEFKKMLPTAGEGTLKNRMLYFKDNIYAKTGTLADVSAIAGYITARSGKMYTFDIMINDPKSECAEKKLLEEYILRAIYTNY